MSIVHPDRGLSVSMPNLISAEPFRATARKLVCLNSSGENAALEEINPYSWPRKPRVDLQLPMAPGVYALFLREGKSLPNINPLEKGLIYIGRGSNLLKRCHFSGKTERHSPRRSLAALLQQKHKLMPEMGANGYYKLSKTSEERLDRWMHDNLLMAFYLCDDFKDVEDGLIRQFAPPLNLTKCKQSDQHKAVKNLRKAMLHYARTRHRK